MIDENIDTAQKCEDKIKELKELLSTKKELHKSLWEGHGSELCAGSMIREETDIEDSIKEYESHLEYLNKKVIVANLPIFNEI